MELHAFNQLHRLHQQQERDAQAPKHRQRKPDALEALSAARSGHGERREVQAKFIDTGRSRTLQAGDYARQADEGFEQFLSPEELAEWKDYTKALDTRANIMASSNMPSPAPPPEVPGAIVRDADPVAAVIEALTRSRTFTSKLQGPLEPHKGSPRVRHSPVDVTPPNAASPQPLINSPLAGKTPRSGRRSQPGAAASVGSTHGMRPSHANIFMLNHSAEHATVQSLLQVPSPGSHMHTQPVPQGSYSGAGAAAGGGPAAALRSSLLVGMSSDGATHRSSAAGAHPGQAASVRFESLSTNSNQNLAAMSSMPDSIDSLTLDDGSVVASPVTSRPRFGRRADTQEMQTIGYGDDDAGAAFVPPRTSMSGAGRMSLARGTSQHITLSTELSASGATAAGGSGGMTAGRAAVNAIEAQAEAARNKFLRLVSARGTDGGRMDGARSKSFSAASGFGRSSISHVTVGGAGDGSGSPSGHALVSTLSSRTAHAAVVAQHRIERMKSISQEAASLPFKPN